MKKVAGIILLVLGLVLLSLNFVQTKGTLPSFSSTQFLIQQELKVENTKSTESVKFILPSVFNFLSGLIRKN